MPHSIEGLLLRIKDRDEEIARLNADLADARQEIEDLALLAYDFNGKRILDLLSDARADLADARERLVVAYALIEECDPKRAAQARAALSAGGGGSTEGGDSEPH